MPPAAHKKAGGNSSCHAESRAFQALDSLTPAKSPVIRGALQCPRARPPSEVRPQAKPARALLNNNQQLMWVDGGDCRFPPPPPSIQKVRALCETVVPLLFESLLEQTGIESSAGTDAGGVGGVSASMLAETEATCACKRRSRELARRAAPLRSGPALQGGPRSARPRLSDSSD